MAHLIDADKLRAEIERRIEFSKKLANVAAEKNLHNTMEANELLVRQYSSLLSFIDTLEEKVEDELEFAKHLCSLWEGEKRVNLDNLIDFLWMQEDSDDNRMVCKKEYFTLAMKEAYSLGIAQADTLEKQK